MKIASPSLATITIGCLIVIAAWFSGAQVARSISYNSNADGGFIHNGAWFTSRHAGSVDADPRTRALVAATGLLALPREEAIYFRAHKDDEGRPISSQYEYVLSGPALPARWWSLTLYDGDNFLNQEARGPFSVKSTTIVPRADGRYSLKLSQNPYHDNWIDMGDGQNMSLSLRVYHPDPALIDRLGDAPLFNIRRVEGEARKFAPARTPTGQTRPLGAEMFVDRADGGRLAFYDRGPKDGDVIVLLASLGRSVADFNHLVSALNAVELRTIAVEMGGVGQSSPVTDAPLSLYDMGEDISAALEAAGVTGDQPISLVGHAFGNRLARAFAHKNSERVEKIVLLAAGGAQNLADMPKARQALADSFNHELSAADHKAAVRYAFFADENEAPAPWLTGWHGAAARAQAQAVGRTPEPEWRKAGGVAPILVIQPKDDRIAPAQLSSELLKRQMPARVRVVIVDGAGHALLPEQPDVVAREVSLFLKSE